MGKRDPKLNGQLADAMKRDPRNQKDRLPKADPKLSAAIQQAQAKGRNQQGWMGEN